MTCLAHGLPCPACGSSDARAVYTDNEYCFSCHTNWFKDSAHLPSPHKPHLNKQLPDDFKKILPEDAKLWFYSVGINDDLIKQYGIGYSRQHNAIVIPFYDDNKLVGYQLKYCGHCNVKYYVVGKPIPFYCFNDNSKVCCIVEDVRSALKLSQYANSIAILGTHVAKKYIPLLLSFNKIIIWLDGDCPGIKGGLKLYNELALATPTTLVSSSKDPKAYSYSEIAEVVA